MNAKGYAAPTVLIDVGFRWIARVTANGTQSIAAATLRFRTVNSLQRYFDQRRDRRERTYGNQRNRRGSPKRPMNFVGDQHSNSEPESRARQHEQTVEWNLLGRFWNGYRERHRIPLYFSF